MTTKKTVRKKSTLSALSEPRKTAAESERDAKKERVRHMKRSLESYKLIGGAEDLIPFSWRFPLLSPEDVKMNKVYREVVALEKSLALRNDRK